MQLRGKIGRWGVAALAVATFAGGSVFAASPAGAQSPSSVPVARFYGNTTFNGGTPVTNLTITGSVGSTVCSATQAGVAGSGTVNSTQYFVDIQAVPGCTTPGATVVFTASSGSSGTYRAKETGTIRISPGTAVHLNLDFAPPATPTAAPSTPPPPPTTVRPTTPVATPPPAATTARPSTPPAVTPTRAAVQRGVVQQAPKGPVAAQGPKSAGGGYYAPQGGGAYQGPAAAPRLPSTGTGGLLDQQSSTSQSGWALAVIVLAALGVSASGLVAYRRNR